MRRDRWWWANECYHCLHRPTLANSRLLWLFVHSVLRWPRRWRRRDGHSGKAANSQKADSSLRELASLRAQIWSSQIANFTGLPFRRSAFWGWTKLWWYVHGVLFGHREHPGEFCLCLSRVGWTVDGQSQGWSRGRSGRVTPIQAFFWREGQTAHKHVSSGQTELKSVWPVWTDSLSYFQPAVLALAWIERFLPRWWRFLKEDTISQTYFLLSIVIFWIEWAPSGTTPLCLGPILGGGERSIERCVCSNFTYPSYVYVLKIG